MVRMVAKRPIPSVQKDGRREVPFDPRRSIRRDDNRVRNANAAAIDKGVRSK